MNMLTIECNCFILGCARLGMKIYAYPSNRPPWYTMKEATQATDVV